MPPLSLDRLRALTGCRPGLSGRWRAGQETGHDGIAIADGWIDHDGPPIPARLLRPGPGRANGAGVLYAHAHGNRHDIGKAELTEGRPALCDPPLGLHLARQGYTVLCPDMPGFGDRRAEGTEAALAKAALWHGRPLLGQMLDDLARAHAALAALPGVAPGRIAALGLSMGATLAYWHGALTPELSACAHFCAFARIGPLIAAGAHDLHGIYMTVPGLLPRHDMDDVAGLIAPRPQLVGAGLEDPLTPAAALDPALAGLRAAYAAAQDRLRVVIEPKGGHAETPAMRAALDAFLTEAL